MNPTITKIDDNKVQVNKDVQTTSTITYTYEDIVANKNRLLSERQNIDAQLLDIDALLAQCLVLGVKEKVVTVNNVSAVADFVGK